LYVLVAENWLCASRGKVQREFFLSEIAFLTVGYLLYNFILQYFNLKKNCIVTSYTMILIRSVKILNNVSVVKYS